LKIFIFLLFENMTIISCFSSWQSSSFLWRAADTTENVDCSWEMRFVSKMLLICFVASCLERWDVIEKYDFRFSSCKKYFCELVLVIMLDHFIVYVSTARLEFFRDDERSLIRFFKMTRIWRDDSSDLTKATHQTWRKRLIKFYDISSNLMNCISSNSMSDISLNSMSDISSNLMSDISSNLINDITSNFERERQSFYFLINDLMHRHIVWKT
jgi:hypothetical protein